MSPIPLGILASSAATGFDPSLYNAVSVSQISSDSDIAEVNGTLIAWTGSNLIYRKPEGGSWSQVTVGNQAYSVASNDNVFLAVPNHPDPQYIRRSTDGLTWTNIPNTYAYWNVWRQARGAGNYLYATHTSRLDREFSFWSDDNGVSRENPFSYSSTDHIIGAFGNRGSQSMMAVAYSKFNANDFLYWVGTGGSWTEYTAPFTWNDASRSITADENYFYGTRGNSKEIWKRTGTNTFATTTVPDNLTGDKRLVYAFGKFLYWNANYTGYWYSDAWDGPYTYRNTGSVKLAADNRRNIAVSETLGKVYVQRYDNNGVVEIG